MLLLLLRSFAFFAKLVPAAATDPSDDELPLARRERRERVLDKHLFVPVLAEAFLVGLAVKLHAVLLLADRADL